ncbi:MAG TPA: FAD binding domain-containing protein [bacterium]|nr:FAD binding domain-containing protein [bacterium]HPN30260.1 FAD binding domain-containing protein [bacterium]
MRIKDFVFARKVSEAYSHLKENGESAYLLAGGTSTFFVKSKTQKVAIDISRLPIKGISKKRKTFKIGALTTIDEILNYKESGWVLNKVALRFVNQQMRNISTIGGNISRVFYWSDFPVVLLALDGKLKITDSKTRNVNISETFKTMSAHKDAFKNSILEFIEIPQLVSDMGFGYSKERRTSGAFSSATTAAFVKINKGMIKDARLALGAVVPFPVRLFDIEKELMGKQADISTVEKINYDSLDKIKFVPRENMTLDYCRHLIKVKIKDVICEALNQAIGGGK